MNEQQDNPLPAEVVASTVPSGWLASLRGSRMPDNTATIHELDAIRAAARTAAEGNPATDAIASVMAEFNGRYMMVNEQGKGDHPGSRV